VQPMPGGVDACGTGGRATGEGKEGQKYLYRGWDTRLCGEFRGVGRGATCRGEWWESAVSAEQLPLSSPLNYTFPASLSKDRGWCRADHVLAKVGG